MKEFCARALVKILSDANNIKNFILKLINIYIGKAYLFYLTFNAIMLIVFFILYSDTSFNSSFRAIFSMISIDSLIALISALIGRLLYQFYILKKPLRKRINIGFGAVIIYAAFIIAAMLLFAFFNSRIKNDELTIQITEYIAGAVISVILNLVIGSCINNIRKINNKLILFASNIKASYSLIGDSQAVRIAIKNFNSESVCDLYIYKVLCGKNIFVNCICLEPYEIYEIDCEENVDKLRVLMLNRRNSFKIGVRNEIIIDLKNKIQHLNSDLYEIENEELPFYPSFRNKISARVVLIDINTLINNWNAIEACKKEIIDTLILEYRDEINSDKAEALIKEAEKLESVEQIKSFCKLTDITVHYDYNKEKNIRGTANLIQKLHKNKSIKACIVGYDKDSINRFRKSYARSLIGKNIYLAGNTSDAIHKAVKENGIDYDECLMISDNYIIDIELAKASGMQTILVNRGKNDAEDLEEYMAADIIVNDITDVIYKINVYDFSCLSLKQ